VWSSAAASPIGARRTARVLQVGFLASAAKEATQQIIAASGRRRPALRRARRRGADLPHLYRRRSARDSIVPPPISAARRAVINSSPHRWLSRPRPSRQAARPYVYASPALGVTARFCRIQRASRQARSATAAGTFARIVDGYLDLAVPSGTGRPRRVVSENRVMPIDSDTLSDGRCQGERANRLRYGWG
jgi:hypothetical protein